MFEVTKLKKKWLGKGVHKPSEIQALDNFILHSSNNPYAPFVGNAAKWEVLNFDDYLL